jgi:hypothetical protein
MVVVCAHGAVETDAIARRDNDAGSGGDSSTWPDTFPAKIGLSISSRPISSFSPNAYACQKTMTSVTTASKSFIEIINQNSQKDHQLPEWIDCYVVTNVDRRSCEPLSRELNNWQRDFAAFVFDNSIDFPRIDHLKRIRRRPATTNEIELREKSEKVTLREKKEVAVGGNDISAIANKTNGSKQGSNNDSTTTPGETKGEKHSAVPAKKRNNKKRNKSGDSPVAVATAPWALDLLIGSTAAIDHSIQTTKDNLSIRLHSILERYDIHPHSSVKKNIVTCRKLPGRPAKTKEERHEWNVSLWPTLFFEEQTLLYKEEQMMLTIEEMNMMRLGLKEAVNDAMVGRKQWNEWKANTPYAAQIVGAVVMNPQTCSIVSRASDERRLQSMPENGCKQNNPTGEDAQKITTKTKSWSTFPDEANPMLCTPVIMAIQGVSRKERQIAMGCGMDSMEFQGGQVRGDSNVQILTSTTTMFFGRFTPMLFCLSRFAVLFQYLCTG